MTNEIKTVNAVTCFLVQNDKVLLQERPSSKVWGKLLNGPGGKVEQGETAAEALLREVYEETGLALKTYQARGRVCLDIPSPTPLLLSVDIFLATEYSGDPEDREGRLAWHHRAELPFQRMWADQKYWLPAVLDGYSVQARISYQAGSLELGELDLRLHSS